MKGWTRGALYDLGPYPGLIQGVDNVAGELWTFHESDMQRVLHELDLVEEYREGMGAANLYTRHVVSCWVRGQSDAEVRAFIYFYNQTLAGYKHIVPAYSFGDRRFALWPEDADW